MKVRLDINDGHFGMGGFEGRVNIPVTQGLCDRVRKMADIVKNNKELVHFVTAFDYTPEWDGVKYDGDSLRADCSQMIVDHQSVRWEAYVKHTPFLIETFCIPFGDLFKNFRS